MPHQTPSLIQFVPCCLIIDADYCRRSHTDWFLFFGYWTLSSLNISNWQSPNTFLTEGLSVAQSMCIIILGRLLITMFSTLIAWCGLRWHIGFTIQNRFSWGMRASYIPLLQRILLNFIWNAIQCWNGGRLAAVCITAIWPSFATMPEFLPASMASVTTGYQFVAFIIFWCISTPFLFIRPENFKWPFRVTSMYCGLGMVCMMIWALATAKGVGPLMTQGQDVPKGWKNSSWLMMAGINQMVGGIAAGITNGSDFSRYAKGPKHYVCGTMLSAWIVGVLVSFVGLVTTSAAQKIYGEVYWNPPDLLMVMMDDGKGSSASRAGVFFLAFGFALTACFENICGNAVAGGIDLAGLFPRYIDIRRGALITFLAAWVCQPWQLVNRAATFVSVLNSFSVFLSPIMGIMATDFFLLRKQNIRLSHLYRTNDTSYWFWHGINWRAVIAWPCGWIPTIGGLVLTTSGSDGGARGFYQLYYMAFLIGTLTKYSVPHGGIERTWTHANCLLLGFFVSSTIFFALNKLFPVAGMGEYDDVDVYGTLSRSEAAKLGVVSCDRMPVTYGDDTSATQVAETFDKK